MNAKTFAIFAVFLVVSSLGFTQADWLDDLNEGTGRVLSTVNENAAKIDVLARNLDAIGKILKSVDPGSHENDD